MPAPAKRKDKTARLNAAAKRQAAEVNEPLWEGPGGKGPNGGVTQSLIGRYLCDPERFRVQFVVGWNPAEKFEARREFGNMWHACEEAYKPLGRGEVHLGESEWEKALRLCCQDLSRRFPKDRDEIVLWGEKCHELFPIYVQYWTGQGAQVKAQDPLFREQVFDVPYELPSGRRVRLRGKWDGGALFDKKIWLDEHKTKSGIDTTALMRQLTFDLQTMTYLTALQWWWTDEKNRTAQRVPDRWIRTEQLAGVRYNVVRRPAHKSVDGMLKKIEDDRKANRMGEWFARFNAEMEPVHLTNFARQCLDPVLENLFDDWEWWDWCFRHGPSYDVFDGDGSRAREFPLHRRRHFRMPYGIYNPLTEGGSGEVDELLNRGSTAGLRRSKQLFEELKR